MTPSRMLALWGWPVALAVLTAAGLVGGLVGDGAWDGLSWIGLGLPVAAALWFGLRGRGGRRDRGDAAPR